MSLTPHETKRLTNIVTSGYIREIDDVVVETTPIPWAGKRCEDCPFFQHPIVVHSIHGRCTVWNMTVPTKADTCAYFDEGNHAAARHAISLRNEMTMPGWEKWMEEHRIPLDERTI